MKSKLCSIAILAVFGLSGCATTTSIQDPAARAAMLAAIPNEEPGDYYIGRRFYKEDYKFWGYVRSPRQPWTTSKLVMLNENRLLAPDRAQWNIGSDNGYEYKLRGFFSGDKVYEPASNGFYSEFVLTGIDLLNTTPGSIFRTREALDPKYRQIAQPY